MKESGDMKRARLVAAVLGSVLVASAAAGQADTAALKDPSALVDTAPESFKVNFDTSAGKFVASVRRSWAPNGADRFYNLVKRGFYDNARFFRVIDGALAQFGVHSEPEIAAVWASARIAADPVKTSNKKGTLTFAMGSGPDTRTTQVFINLTDNMRLDASGFAPFGEISSGLDVVEKLYSGYGDGPPRGKGPNPGRLQLEGNVYLAKEFPKLSYIKTATVAK
jgi:peptidyl-prolyl cis-trans isomerase A (cyclophilin A)